MVLYAPELSIIDDHTLVGSLLAGESIPLHHHVIPDIGRFFPLNGQDLNILSALFAPSPKVFYTFNAICVLLVSACLVYSLRILLGAIVPDSAKHTRAIKLTNYALVIYLLLTPAFNGSWLRLFVPERMEFVFLSIALASYATILRFHTRPILCLFALIVGVTSALVACFYKETAFILIGSFAFMHLLLLFVDSRIVYRADMASSPESKPRSNVFVVVFDMLLLGVCMVWVVAYYVFVLAHKSTQGRYGDTPHNPLIMLAKNFFTYAMNEPLLFLCIPVLLLVRVVMIVAAIRSRQSTNPARSPFIPLLDSGIFASVLFMLAYLVLNIASAHYPLPAYIFALIGLGWAIVARDMIGKFAKRSITAVFALSIAIFVSSSLPYALHTIAHYKGVPHNFQSTLHFLAEHATQPSASQSTTPESSLPKTIDIMLEGVDCSLIEKSEVCYSFEKWLEYYGVETKIIADRDLYNPLRKSQDSSALSNTPQPQNLPKGAYLIVTPFSSNPIDSAYIQNLDSTYDRVYSAEFGWNLGFVGIKALMKYLALKRGDSSVAFSGNVWNLPVHFYVYTHKREAF